MNIYEDIRKNSGISDVIYLEEGIVFFKNSNKLKRLAKHLDKKYENLLKKRRTEEANEILNLTKEVDKIADKFEDLEKEFKSHSKKSGERDGVKAKYKDLENEYQKLISIANKETLKKALLAAGALALVAGVLLAAGFGFMSLLNSGIIERAADNLTDRELRWDLFGADRVARSRSALTPLIKETNKDLLIVAAAQGATVAGLVGAGVLPAMKASAAESKSVEDTIKTLENYKSLETKNKVSKSSEDDEEIDKN